MNNLQQNNKMKLFQAYVFILYCAGTSRGQNQRHYTTSYMRKLLFNENTEKDRDREQKNSASHKNSPTMVANTISAIEIMPSFTISFFVYTLFPSAYAILCRLNFYALSFSATNHDFFFFVTIRYFFFAFAVTLV